MIGGSAELLVLSNNLSRVYEILNVGIILRAFDAFNVVLVKGDVGLVGRLVRDPSVTKILPNFIVKAQVIDDVRIANANLSLTSSLFSWGKSRVGSDVVRRLYNLTGAGTVVAVLDTGIFLEHSELRGKLLTTNPLDERYPGGWIEFDRRGRPICSSPRDTHFHGTWVSSILAGNTIGIAPGARLMHALVLHGGEGTAAQVLAGLEWALNPYTCTGVKVNIRPDVVSMSLGSSGNYSDVFLTPISKLIESNITVVAAIGNDGPGTTSNPGNIWGVVGVGALRRDDSVADFSSSEYVEWPSQPGEWPFKGSYPRSYIKPDFVAPGVLIPGAYVIDGYYVIASGTSASTPIVAGVVALLKEAWKRLGIEVGAHEVYEVLNKTADRVCDISRCGWGAVNAIKAASYLYGRVLKDTTVSVNASNTRPLEAIEITSTRQMMYFMNGNEVGRGLSVVARVPLLDMGYHFIHAVSDEHYGYLKFYVSPLVALDDRTVVMGGRLMMIVSGFPGISDILIYLDDNLLAYRPLSISGSYVLSLVIPYVSPGTYRLTVVDTLGLASYEEKLSVVEARALSPTRELRMHILGPQIAYVGTPVSVYLISSVGSELVDLSMLSYRFIGKQPTNVVGPTRLEKGVYTIRFTPEEVGTYMVVIEGSIEEKGVTLRGLSALSVNVMGYETMGGREAYLKVVSICEDIRGELGIIANGTARVSELLVKIDDIVGELRQEMQLLRSTLRDAMTNILTMGYAIAFLVIALLILSIVRKALSK